MKKKGQSGTNAAILVAIIMLFIIAYVMVIPTEDVIDLLGENGTSVSDDTSTDTQDGNVLLSEKVGKLEYLSKDSIEHTLGSLKLALKTEDNIVKTVDSLYIKNGVFDEESKKISLNLDELENINKVSLSFTVNKRAGRLIIKLNDEEVFNNEISTVNVEPIELPMEHIKEQNILEFSVSSVGLKFWSTNEYNLETIQVITRTKDASGQEAAKTFPVSSSEAQNIENAVLMFSARCNPNDVGPLEIAINNHHVFSGIPDCSIPTRSDFSPYHLIIGDNKIKLKSTKGTYNINSMIVKTTLKEQPSYIYYFELSKEKFDKIENEDAKLTLNFKFVEKGTEKEAELIINGKKTFLPRTEGLTFTKNIDSYIEKGSNSIKIVPKITMDIRELTVNYKEN